MRKLVLTLVALVAMLAGMSQAKPAAAQDASWSASDLRALLTQQLGEHVMLASAATNAAINGSTPEFEQAAAALDVNTVALSESIGAIYGEDAAAAFLPLWRVHIGFFVDYTTGAATDDQAMKDKAVADLDGYRRDFGAFVSSANPNLTTEAVADALIEHVATLTAVIDAQAEQDYESAYASLRESFGHSGMLADVLAGAFSTQFPDKFGGMSGAPAADLRALLTQQLGEHVYLAGMTTNAALQGREAEFEAAAAALDGNTVDLSESIGSVYGKGAGDAFLPLWRAHIGFFVDYTMGAAAGDQAMKDKAVADLDGYRRDFGAFISSANPNLTTEAIAEALVEHVATLAGAVDAQAEKDFAGSFTLLRQSYSHSGMLAATLAGAIAQQFPDQFAGGGAMPHTMPATGLGQDGETQTPWSLYVLYATLAAGVAIAFGTAYTARRSTQ